MSDTLRPPVTNGSAPALQITASRQFNAWLAEQGAGLAFTTYQTGKLFLLGLQPDDRLSIFERTFNRATGLWVSPDGRTLFLGTLFQLWRFDDALASGHRQPDYDRLYVPQAAVTTGDLKIHDVAFDRKGRILFVNTLFSCLATVSETHSFVPLWRPPFISGLAPEDRCHLSGLALRDGEGAFVTAFSSSDAPEGWRDQHPDGGLVVDVRRAELVLDGLSMPHSPRWYDERLWLLESGTGWFGHVDLKRGRFERIAFCPGYARGLTFFGPFAIIGLSGPRLNRPFTGLALEGELAAQGTQPRCGIMAVDLRTGEAFQWVRIQGVVSELYDVAVLPGTRRPMAIGLRTDEIRRVFTMDEPEPL